MPRLRIFGKFRNHDDGDGKQGLRGHGVLPIFVHGAEYGSHPFHVPGHNGVRLAVKHHHGGKVHRFGNDFTGVHRQAVPEHLFRPFITVAEHLKVRVFFRFNDAHEFQGNAIHFRHAPDDFLPAQQNGNAGLFAHKTFGNAQHAHILPFRENDALGVPLQVVQQRPSEVIQRRKTLPITHNVTCPIQWDSKKTRP